MRKSNYNNQPKGCRFSTSTTGKMVAVSLDDMAVQENRAQRRYALRELRKLKKQQATRP